MKSKNIMRELRKKKEKYFAHRLEEGATIAPAENDETGEIIEGNI